jgi:hypothetical protein
MKAFTHLADALFMKMRHPIVALSAVGHCESITTQFEMNSVLKFEKGAKMSTQIPAGLILGTCVLCAKEFRAVSDIELYESKEFWFRGKGDQHQYLSISKLTYLLVMGWLILGRSKEIWSGFVKSHAGVNLQEFVQSSTCQNCFPSDTSSDSSRRPSQKDPEEDLDDDPPTEVQSLLIKSNGDSMRVLVSDDVLASDVLKCDDVEYYYDRDNGVFVYFSLSAVRGSAIPNVYGSALCNSYIAGDCLVISDLDSDSNRTSDYTNLTNDWFDPAFFKMIQRCNTDTDAIGFLRRHKP